MRPRALAREALRSLRRHGLRSALPALGVLTGVLALVALLAVTEGARRETLALIEQLGTDNVIARAGERSSAQALAAGDAARAGFSLEDVERIRAGVPGVAGVAPLAEVRAELADLGAGATAQVLAVTADYFAAKQLTLSAGRPLCAGDVSARALVCVLGAEVARGLGASGRPGAVLRAGDALLEVAGVLAPREWRAARLPALAARDLNRAVLVPLGSHLALAPRPSGAGELDEISVRLESSGAVEAGAAALSSALARARGGVVDFQVIVPHELLRQARRTQAVFALVLAATALVCLLVGGGGIASALVASVSERTAEIGVRRAVGATRADVAVQFLAEAAVLSAAGSAAGLAAGVAVARAAGRVAGWPVVVTPGALGLALAMAALVSLAAGLAPALRAARLDPIAALRHT